MLNMSKNFGREYRLQADSYFEVRNKFDLSVLSLAREVRFQGRKLRGGPLLNALVLWFASLDHDEQVAKAKEALAILERDMAMDSRQTKGYNPLVAKQDFGGKPSSKTVPKCNHEGTNRKRRPS